MPSDLVVYSVVVFAGLIVGSVLHELLHATVARLLGRRAWVEWRSFLNPLARTVSVYYTIPDDARWVENALINLAPQLTGTIALLTAYTMGVQLVETPLHVFAGCVWVAVTLLGGWQDFTVLGLPTELRPIDRRLVGAVLCVTGWYTIGFRVSLGSNIGMYWLQSYLAWGLGFGGIILLCYAGLAPALHNQDVDCVNEPHHL